PGHLADRADRLAAIRGRGRVRRGQRADRGPAGVPGEERLMNVPPLVPPPPPAEPPPRPGRHSKGTVARNVSSRLGRIAARLSRVSHGRALAIGASLVTVI